MEYVIPTAVAEEQNRALLNFYDTEKSRQLLSSYHSDATHEALDRAHRIAEIFNTCTEEPSEDPEESWDILKERTSPHATAKGLEVTIFRTMASRMKIGNI